MLKTNQISPLQKNSVASQMIAAITTFSSLALMPLYSFAAKTGLDSAVNKILEKIGLSLTNILGPLCVLILGIAIFTIIVGKNSKSAESGMDWAKRSIIGFIAFNLLGSILAYGNDLFVGLNTRQWVTTSFIDTLPCFPWLS